MDQLRQAAKKSGQSMNALSRKSGVPYAAVYRCLEKGKSPTVITLEKLAAALELEIIVRPKGDTGKKE